MKPSVLRFPLPTLVLLGVLLSGMPSLEAQTNWPTTIERLKREVRSKPRDRNLTHQLAVAYNNYAIEKGNQGNWEEASRLDQVDPEPSEDRKKDAMEWENLFGGSMERLVSAIGQGEQLEQRMIELSASWVRVSAGDTNSSLEEEFNRQTQQIEQELENNKQEIQAARDAIEALEREARLDGVPPGTIRQMVEDLP